MKTGFRVLMLVLAANLYCSAGELPLPGGSQDVYWEAEKAQPTGGWKKVADAAARGGAYMSNEQRDGDNVLGFPFVVDKDGVVRVTPVWWRNSEEKPAVRFPKTLPQFQYQYVWPAGYTNRKSLNPAPFWVKRKPGPDKLALIGDRLYFNGPEAGRVGIVDMKTEKLAGCIVVGGYPADLVADPGTGRLLVADAQRDQLVAIDAKTETIVKKVPVGKCPFSLAVDGESVIVACMEGKSLEVLDRERLAPKRKLPLPFKPQAVSLVGGDKKMLVVWPVPLAFDPDTGKPSDPDRLVYPEVYTFPWTEPPQNAPIGFIGNKLKIRTPLFPRSYYIRYLDVGVFKFSARQVLMDRKNPKSAVKVEKMVDLSGIFKKPGKECPLRSVVLYGRRVYFLAPGGDFLYSIDLANPGEPKKHPCGKPSSLTVFVGEAGGRYAQRLLGQMLQIKHIRPRPPRKIAKPIKDTWLLVADRQGKRVLVICPKNADTILREIKVPGTPEYVSTSRSFLYVTCTNPNKVFMIDLHTDRVVRSFALPSEPECARAFRSFYGPVSWLPPPPMAEMPLRLVVQLKPQGFDPATLESRPTGAVSYLPPSRSILALEGGKKRIWSDNMHSVCVDGETFIDTSPVTDLYDSTQLAPGDMEGTATLSIDDGPENDWTNDRYITRDFAFPVRGSEEFKRINSPLFRVSPGRHVLKVRSRSPWARLDALQVRSVLDGVVDLSVRPEPDELHSKVLSPSYRGVFRKQEPVRFSAHVTNKGDAPMRLELRWRVRNFTDAVVAQGEESLSADKGATVIKMLGPKLDKTGVFALDVTCRAPDGAEVSATRRFARLGRLVHPSLFYRPRDVAAIRRRIAAYPRLFERYRKWLRRHIAKPGFLPKRMGGGAEQSYVQMEGRWRAIACGFAALFLEKKDPKFFVDRVAPLMSSGHQEGYEHAWPFAGAVAVFYDMMAKGHPSIAKYYDSMYKTRHDKERVPETLMTARDPLDPDIRAVVDSQVRDLANCIEYFRTHVGRRGGNWWQGTRSNCGCFLHAVFRNFLYYRGFLDMPDLFDATFFTKVFTHFHYAVPRYDRRHVINRALAVRSPGHHGTGGEITAMLASLMSRNPVDRKLYDINKWIEKMDGPMGRDEDAQVDKLMSLTNHFVFPLFLAFGWYDPKSPTLDWEDLPLSIAFDVEGEVSFKSDWSPAMTDIYFFCGARDVSYRVEPNHLRIMKAGEVLLGTRALQGDHGDPVPSWGNVVIIGDKTPGKWRYAADWPRMNEQIIINRFAPEVREYLMRDFALAGIKPLNFPYRMVDGIVLHCHSEHKFYQAGRLIAYETSPEFDYVAGDATGAWPIEQAESMSRQVVYLRPDIVVVYDRARLNSGANETRWIASATRNVAVSGNTFICRANRTSLAAVVLAPSKCKVETQGTTVMVNPLTTGDKFEYLVVFKAGLGRQKKLDAKRIGDAGMTGVAIRFNGKNARVLFNRTGAVGGVVTVGSVTNHELAEKVDHSYRQWKTHHLFKKWMQDPRLRDYVTEEDRREFGSVALPDIEPPAQEPGAGLKGPEQIKGARLFEGVNVASVPGGKCPNLNLGLRDFMVQVRLRLAKGAPLARSEDAYTILTKGVYSSPLLQFSVRGGSYNGAFCRVWSAKGRGYRDLKPGKNLASVFLDGKFHTITAVRRGKVGVLYVDGKEVGRHNDFGHAVQNNLSLEVGRVANAAYFEGYIDDLRVWRFDGGIPGNYAEAISAYKKERDAAPAILKSAPSVKYSHWKFNEPPDAEEAADSGNNGYDLRHRN